MSVGNIFLIQNQWNLGNITSLIWSSLEEYNIAEARQSKTQWCSSCHKGPRLLPQIFDWVFWRSVISFDPTASTMTSNGPYNYSYIFKYIIIGDMVATNYHQIVTNNYLNIPFKKKDHLALFIPKFQFLWFFLPYLRVELYSLSLYMLFDKAIWSYNQWQWTVA